MLVVKALAEMVPPMQRLEQLNLLHNPVCSANRMRQNVLMWGPGLHVLDEKEVPHNGCTTSNAEIS